MLPGLGLACAASFVQSVLSVPCWRVSLPCMPTCLQPALFIVQHNELTLEEPLAGCSLFEAALFLRLCYRPQELTPANLASERGSLPALLRMADKLDAQRILQATADCMKGGLASAGSFAFSA